MKSVRFALLIVSSLWAFNGFAQSWVSEPTLIDPVTSSAEGIADLSSLTWWYCSVDQGGLKCWGWLSWQTPKWPNGTKIVAGGGHLCGLFDQKVECVGRNNYYGELSIPPSLANVESVSAGEFHNCAVTKSNSLTCWGKNDFGQATLPSNLPSIKYVSAARLHTCALTIGGRVQCWGDNRYGQLNVPENLGEVVSLQASYDKRENVQEAGRWTDGTCANDVFGGVAERKVCWGKPRDGSGVSLQNIKIEDLENRQISNYYTCGTLKGLLLCDGLLPMANPPLVRDVVSISVGRDSACAIRSDGSSVCWGKK